MILSLQPPSFRQLCKTNEMSQKANCGSTILQMITNIQDDNKINEALAWGDFLIGTKRKEECLPH